MNFNTFVVPIIQVELFYNSLELLNKFKDWKLDRIDLLPFYMKTKHFTVKVRKH